MFKLFFGILFYIIKIWDLLEQLHNTCFNPPWYAWLPRDSLLAIDSPTVRRSTVRLSNCRLSDCLTVRLSDSQPSDCPTVDHLTVRQLTIWQSDSWPTTHETVGESDHLYPDCQLDLLTVGQSTVDDRDSCTRPSSQTVSSRLTFPSIKYILF